MKVVIMIQARRGSSRLPDKVLLPVLGKPILSRMIERVLRSRYSEHLTLVTTTDSQDDVIEEVGVISGVQVYRGHPTDLLDRHYQAARHLVADAVVKIPSDCPLIDPSIIDRVIGYFKQHFDQFDYVSNLHPATYPDGNDVEIMSFTALERAWHEASRPLEREHTTPYIWENPDRFRIGNVLWDSDIDLSMSHRWTIDYWEDYLLIRSIFEKLYPNNSHFSLDHILRLIEEQPELMQINEKYVGVNWYRHHLGELKTIAVNQTKSLRGEKC